MKTIQSKNVPAIKPWVRQIAEASGMLVNSPEREDRLGWWGVEMVRFLKFCENLPDQTALRDALVGYGVYLKSHEPPLAEWRLQEARDALRCFQKGVDGWKIHRLDPSGSAQVNFRAKTRREEPEDVVLAKSHTDRVTMKSWKGGDGYSSAESTTVSAQNWLEKSSRSMRVRRLALRTVESYLGWQKRFLAWTQEKQMEPERTKAVQEFLTELAVERKVSAATQNQALSALLFLTMEVMGQEMEGLDAVRARRSRQLPEVLSREEVRRLLSAADGMTGLMLRLIYGTGMRLMECLRLRVKDVDFDRGLIMVRQGKGGKDRVVMLPKSLKVALEEQRARVSCFGTRTRRRDCQEYGCRRRWR